MGWNGRERDWEGKEGKKKEGLRDAKEREGMNIDRM